MNKSFFASFFSKKEVLASFSRDVTLSHVTKRFGPFIANDDISLTFHRGEVHSLLGENGAGKSTLISLLAGVQRPDRGTIRIDGVPVVIKSPGRALALGIGTVYQHSMLVPGLTVVENLLLGAAWFHRPDRAAAAARLAGNRLGIAIDPHTITGRLSLGEQQQVEILRALWRGSRLIVLDEPTAMLTPDDVARLIAILRRLAAEGVGVVFITHKLDEALDAGDRVSVLRQGRVAGALSPEALRAADRRALRARITCLMFGEGDAASLPVHRPALPLVSPVLEVAGLTVRMPRRPPPLDDVSFSVAAGEIFGIAGVDGNGQRELAQALSGQIASEGRVTLHGIAMSGLDVAARYRAGLRTVTDDRLHEGTVGALSVADNLVLKQIGEAPFWRYGIARRRVIDAHAAALMAAHDIRAPGPHTPVGRLSGGNIQKALLARELQGAARMVIFHKPTHGLDWRNILAARQRIRDGAGRGLVTVLISTDLDEILEVSDRIGVLSAGRLVGIVPNGASARGAVARLMAGAAMGAAA